MIPLMDEPGEDVTCGHVDPRNGSRGSGSYNEHSLRLPPYIQRGIALREGEVEQKFSRAGNGSRPKGSSGSAPQDAGWFEPSILGRFGKDACGHLGGPLRRSRY
jgi:hypothetical protein